MAFYAITILKPLMIVLVAAVALAIPCHAQRATETPLLGGTSEAAALPEGSRLRATYETFEGGIEVFAPQARMSAAAVAPSVAERIQPRLPAGFSLGEGYTRAVMSPRPEPAREVPAPNEDEEARLRAISKFVTLFPLRYQTIPLSKGSDYLAITSGDGRLLATRSRSVPTQVDAIQPTLPAAEAIRIAREHAQDALEGEEPEVDAPRLEIWVDRTLTGTLTWTFTLRSSSLQRPLARRYWIKATGEPSIVNWESQIFHNHHGTVTATIWRTPRIRAHGRPLPHVGVNRLVGGALRVFTNEDGSYRFPSGTGEATIRSALGGISCVSQNVAGPHMVRTGSGDTSSPIDLDFDAGGEFEMSQTSGYFWCEFAHSFAQLETGVLRQLPVRVNINSSCNAFYNGSNVSLNFFRAGDGCPNTAYSDVILHEYGHAVDDEQGGILDGGLSEGFGDALAILATQQPCTGRDFFGSGTCLRDARDVVRWPPNDGEEHLVGRIYGGFVWELVEQLSGRLAEDEAFAVATDLVLAAAVANPSDIPDAVRLSFLMDDTDGDPSTCSPNFNELTAAAASRRIPRPASDAPANLEIQMRVFPAGDPGRFNVRIDGATVLFGAGHGASTGPQTVSAGPHSISQTAAIGTDLSDYRTFIGGACAPGGSVTLGSCQSKTCLVTNVFSPGQECGQQCRDQRDLCMEDGTLLPRICVQMFKFCLSTCN